MKKAAVVAYGYADSPRAIPGPCSLSLNTKQGPMFPMFDNELFPGTRMGNQLWVEPVGELVLARLRGAKSCRCCVTRAAARPDPNRLESQGDAVAGCREEFIASRFERRGARGLARSEPSRGTAAAADRSHRCSPAAGAHARSTGACTT